MALTREMAKRAVQRARVRIIAESVHGIELRRAHSTGFTVMDTWKEELWRVHSGGGIAGNSGSWWISRVGGAKRALGPFTTSRALVRALIDWKHWREVGCSTRGRYGLMTNADLTARARAVLANRRFSEKCRAAVRGHEKRYADEFIHPRTYAVLVDLGVYVGPGEQLTQLGREVACLLADVRCNEARCSDDVARQLQRDEQRPRSVIGELTRPQRRFARDGYWVSHGTDRRLANTLESKGLGKTKWDGIRLYFCRNELGVEVQRLLTERSEIR